MAVESATTINQLDATKPGINDLKSEGDDHIRLVKSTIKATFPNVTGAVTATHTELNTVAAKAPIASPTFTGTVTIPPGASISGFAPLASPALTGVPTAPTASTGTNTTQLATTAHVQAVFSTAPTGTLPSALGKALFVLRVNAGESGVEWSQLQPALYSAGAVGAYMLARVVSTSVTYNSTTPASNLAVAGGTNTDWVRNLSQPTLSGTWRNMGGGQVDGEVSTNDFGLFQRIS